MANETINTLPSANSSFVTAAQTFWRDELPGVLSRALPSVGWVASGGVHATAGGMTSAAFATEAFTASGERLTADGAGGSVAINYTTMGAAASDTCWVIISGMSANQSGNFNRVGTSKYFVDTTSSSQPSLPSNSCWLMKVTIAASAISAITDLRLPSSFARHRLYDVTDPIYGAIGDGSTDDTTAVAAAVAVAYAQTQPLYFPRGTYLVTDTIPHLHDITHAGTGAIKRGTDTFYAQPTSAQSNTLYVATSGSDTNDGLTSAKPFATLAHALSILNVYGPALDGTWTIKLAAGTYSEGNIDAPVILGNRNRIVIQGPVVGHPNVPTAILDGTTGTKVYGLNFNSRGYFTVSNIKVQNYTTYGVVGQDLGDVTCVNVHAASISGGPGIKMQQGRLRVQGGILTSCQSGVTCISNCTFTIGDPAAASTANGTQFINCTQNGILAQEGATGHADYCTIDNCAVGLDIVEKSRVHAQACVIKNNATAGVRVRQDSSWFDNGTSANFTGNTNNCLVYSFSGEIGRTGSFTTCQQAAVDHTFNTYTGVLASTVERTYSTAIAADSFNNPTKMFRMVVYGTITGTTNTKNLTFNLAGSAWTGFTMAAGVTGDFVMDATIMAFGASGSQQSYHATMSIDGQSMRVQQGSRSISMVTGSDIAATILVTLNGAGDTMDIRGVERYNWGYC